MEFLFTFIFLIVINLYFSLFLNFNQTNKNLVSLILFFVFMSLFIIFYYKFEFLGYAYLLVYVGAIAVLFLFLLISVNIKVESKKMIFNRALFTFLFLFNCISIPLYFLFLIIYNKIKNIHYIQGYLNYLKTKEYSLQLLADNICDNANWLPLVNGNLEKKLDLLNSLLSQAYKNNLNQIDNYNFFRYMDNKINILGDYFLIYHNFFLVVISILLFISIIVSVTICLAIEAKK